MQKYQYFNGIKFTRDNKTGYYLNSTIRKRMHRYVWEFYNGEIPKGFHIHHKDKDKANNDIINLEPIPFSAHAKLHNKEKAEENHDSIIENLNNNARPKAIEWHKSEEGRKWHKEHYERMKKDLHPEKMMICEMCKREYIGKTSAENRFCSNNCRAAWRRKQGLNKEKRICIICDKEFETDKYKKTMTCSRACANRLRTLK
jgi:hypothetical protein